MTIIYLFESFIYYHQYYFIVDNLKFKPNKNTAMLMKLWKKCYPRARNRSFHRKQLLKIHTREFLLQPPSLPTFDQKLDMNLMETKASQYRYISKNN